MKNNRSKKIKFVLILIASLIMPFYVNAADEVYYVKTSKSNPLRNLKASAYFYKPAVEKKQYVNAVQCKTLGGTYDQSDCAWYWYEYYYSCKYNNPLKGDHCNEVSANPSNRVSSKYILSSQTGSLCSGNGYVKCRYKIGTPDEYYKYYDFPYVYNSHGTRQCTLYSFTSAKSVTFNGQTYAFGDFGGGRCYKGSPVCACTTTKAAQSGYTVNNLSTYDANVDGTDVYCVNPGLSFPPSTVPYKKESANFNLNNCSGATGTKQYACGVASIFQKATELGVTGDYATMIVALRLWSSENGFGDGNDNSNDEIGLSELLVTRSKLYGNTASLIKGGGYTGSTTKPKDEVIFAGNSTGLTQLQNAISLYQAAIASDYKSWSPEISNGSTPIEVDDGGNFNFTITANFDDENTSEIAVISKTSRVTLSISSKGACGEKYCIEVSGKISGFNKNNCDISSVEYELEYRDKRDITAALLLLKPTQNESKYQKFIYYNKDKVGQKVKHPKTISLKCPPEFECPQPQIIYDQTSGCHNEGTTGELIDPTVECILNVSKLRQNYDFSDIYIHDTGFGYTNDYCEVKCRETIKYDMYGHTNAASVRFIKYTNGAHGANALLATISGERDCVADIDYDSWKADFEDANEKVRTTWNTYKYYENLHVYTTPRPEVETCVYSYPPCSNCCNCHSCPPCTTTTTTNPDGSTSSSTSCSRCCSPGPGAECNTSANWLYWDPKDYQETTESGATYITQSSGQDTVKSCSGSTCGGVRGCYVKEGNPNKYAGAYSSAKRAYENAVDARAELVGYIQDCNLYSGFSVGQVFRYSRDDDNSVWYEATEGYDFDPNYEYEYEDSYSSMIQIDKETELTSTTSARYCVGCSETSALGGNTLEELKYWICKGTQTSAICEDKRIKVPKNTMALIEATKETYFWQSVEFSSTIPYGEIVASSDSKTLELSDKNIFPLEIGKLSGTYYANAVHGNVGDADRKNPIKYQEPGEQAGEYIETYMCDFTVDNEITIMPPRCPNGVCPPDPDPCPGCNGKYGYYFRQIDLTNMFPSGVKTGSWSTVQAQALISEIESKGEDIYKGTPDYEFVITPKNIRNIKEYNREIEAYGQGYNDFNLDCDCQTGICYCNSIFLASISDGGPYANLVTSFKKDGIEYRSGN